MANKMIGGLQIGIVTALEDPKGEDHIQVVIPAIEETAGGIWARMARADAGKNRGIIFLPEIGDEVVLSFIGDDLYQPVILGMLNSSERPAPISQRNANGEKVIMTRSRMRIQFNDEERKLSIQTAAGNKLQLDDGNASISMEDQHGNRIVMDARGIMIESERDIAIKAANSLSMKGEMSASLNSEGNTTIKGSLVNIN